MMGALCASLYDDVQRAWLISGMIFDDNNNIKIQKTKAEQITLD